MSSSSSFDEYTTRCLEFLVPLFHAADVTLAQLAKHAEHRASPTREDVIKPTPHSAPSNSDTGGDLFTFVTPLADQRDDESHPSEDVHTTRREGHQDRQMCDQVRFDDFELHMSETHPSDLPTTSEAPFYHTRVSSGDDVVLHCNTNRMLGQGVLSRVYAGRLSCSSPIAQTRSGGHSRAATFHDFHDESTMDRDRHNTSRNEQGVLTRDVAVKVWYEPRRRWRDADEFADFWCTLFRMAGSHEGLMDAYGIHVSAAIPRHGGRQGRCEEAYLCCQIVSELGRGGSLDRRVEQRERLAEAEIRAILVDVVATMDWMHRHAGRCHNDVKPHNIVDTSATAAFVHGREGTSSATSPSVRYKLIDWSSSSVLTSRSEVHSKLCHMWRMHLQGEHDSATTRGESRELARMREQSEDRPPLLGTVAFMSPEGCLGLPGSAAGDVWSLGITVFYLATGRVPWTAMEAAVPELIVHHVRHRFRRGCLFPFQCAARSTAADIVSERGKERCVCAQALHDRRGKAHNTAAAAAADGASKEEETPVEGLLLDEMEDHSSYSVELRSFVHMCLADDPLQRPTCEALLKHPFLQR